MKALAAALAAVLVSVPALAAAGGPDALSIAKHALRLAKQPPNVEYVYSDNGVQVDGGLRYTATCPRGMLPISEFHEFEGSFSIKGRSVVGFRPGPIPIFGGSPGLTAVCLKAR